jgi:hypothetical protein
VQRCLVPVIYCVVPQEASSLRARRWCFLGPLRTRAGAGSVARYTMQDPAWHAALQCAGAARRGAREGERRRNEKKGEVTKEVARAVGGKATGAWMIGGRGGSGGSELREVVERRRAMDHGCDRKALCCGAGDRDRRF